MKLVFISDLHLSDKTIEHNKIFYKLMDTWQDEIDALYILGDFFDFWCGDDDDNEFIRSIKNSFKSFTKKKPIYFLGGNHDFGVGKVFAKETGITFIHDMTVLNVSGNTILLSHGDTFCTLDISYQRLKLILQNRFTKFILRRVPLSWRYKLKEKLEHKSGESFNAKPLETYHVVDKTVAQYANKFNSNIVIHGHTHRPNIYKINTPKGDITRYEIPDWEDHAPGGYVILNDANIQIQFV